MRGEGGKRLLDGLLVADVRKHAFECRKLRPLLRGNEHAAHRHQCKESDGFERHGLAAGVRARDNQRAEGFAKPDVDGNHAVFGDQRMPSANDAHTARLVELRSHRALISRHDRARKDDVQRAHDVAADMDFVRKGRNHRGQTGENPLDLDFFFKEEPLVLVAEFHHGGGFDKQRRSAAALVMHQSRHLRAIFRLDGQHVAPVSDRDNRFLQVFLRGLAFEHAVELLAHAFANDLDLPADAPQLRRGVVRNLVLAEDATRNFFLDRAMRSQAVGKIAKKAVFVAGLQHLFCFPRGAHRLRDCEQFPRAQKERRMHAPNHLSHIGKAGDRRSPGACVDALRFPSLLLKRFRLFERCCRAQFFGKLVADFAGQMLL